MGSVLSRVSSKSSSKTTEKMASPAFSYHAKAQSSFKPPLIANDNAFLGDVFSRYAYIDQSISLFLHDEFFDKYIKHIRMLKIDCFSTKNDPDKPVSAGFFRLEKGTPLEYEYTYHEMKIILEGEFIISDETGQKVTAGLGDVFYFPKGSKITFETRSYGLAFYVCSLALFFFCYWNDANVLCVYRPVNERRVVPKYPLK